MKHETEIYDGEPLNFETIYNRYIKFANQNSSIQSVQRPVIMKAFEHIKVKVVNKTVSLLWYLINEMINKTSTELGDHNASEWYEFKS